MSNTNSSYLARGTRSIANDCINIVNKDRKYSYLLFKKYAVVILKLMGIYMWTLKIRRLVKNGNMDYKDEDDMAELERKIR